MDLISWSQKIRQELDYTENDSFCPSDLSLFITTLIESTPDHMTIIRNPEQVALFCKDIEFSSVFSSGVSQWLSDNSYLERIYENLQERSLLNNKEVPCLRINPIKITPDSQDIILGVIYSGDSGSFQDTIHSLQLNAWETGNNQALTVLAIHKDWLILDNHTVSTKRALILETESQMVADTLFDKPVTLNAAVILHLNPEREWIDHQEISEILSQAGVMQLNPWNEGVMRANSKYESWMAWDSNSHGNLHQPATILLQQNDSIETLGEKITQLLKQPLTDNPSLGLYLLPDHGTEGIDTYYWDNPSNKIHKIIPITKDNILPKDSAVLRNAVGNLYFSIPGDKAGYRQITFRINVFWDGESYQPESGFALVAKDENIPISSVSHKGTVYNWNDLDKSLFYELANHYYPLQDLKDLFDTLNTSAREAMQLFNQDLSLEDRLFIAGLDFVIECQLAEDKTLHIYPVILEINPRPSGFSSSYELTVESKPHLMISHRIFNYLNSQISHSSLIRN